MKFCTVVLKLVITLVLVLNIVGRVASADQYAVAISCFNGTRSAYAIPTIFYESQCEGDVFENCCWALGRNEAPTTIDGILKDTASFYLETKATIINRYSEEIATAAAGDCQASLGICNKALATLASGTNSGSNGGSSFGGTTTEAWRKRLGESNPEFKATFALSQVRSASASEVYTGLLGSIDSSASLGRFDPGEDLLSNRDVLAMLDGYLYVGLNRPTFKEEYFPYLLANVRHGSDIGKSDLLKILIPEFSAVVKGSLTSCIYSTACSLILIVLGFKVKSICLNLTRTIDKRVKSEDMALKDIESRITNARKRENEPNQNQGYGGRGRDTTKFNGQVAIEMEEDVPKVQKVQVKLIKVRTATVLEGDSLKALAQMGLCIALCGIVGAIYAAVQWVTFALSIDEFPFLDTRLQDWMRYLMGGEVSGSSIMGYMSTIGSLAFFAFSAFFVFRANQKVNEKMEVIKDEEIAEVLNSVAVPAS